MKRIATLVLVIAGVGAFAQERTAPTFDIVSVKPNNSGEVANRLAIEPGGRYRWTNWTLEQLIGQSYQRRGFDNREIIGGPDWLKSARFDVVAHTESSDPLTDANGFPGPLFAMIRTMLQDRFQLRTHDEQRERPIYVLTLASRDGKLGPRLTRSTVDCAAIARDEVKGKLPDVAPGQPRPCAVRNTPGHVTASAVDLDGFAASVIARTVGRPVVNRTGLNGAFDIDLEFTPELVQGGPGDVGARPAGPTDAPSIFTAVQEQLGLKLDSTRAPVDVLVIDRAERPSEN